MRKKWNYGLASIYSLAPLIFFQDESGKHQKRCCVFFRIGTRGLTLLRLLLCHCDTTVPEQPYPDICTSLMKIWTVQLFNHTSINTHICTKKSSYIVISSQGKSSPYYLFSHSWPSRVFQQPLQCAYLHPPDTHNPPVVPTSKPPSHHPYILIQSFLSAF